MTSASEKSTADLEWLQYPTNLEIYDSLAVDGSACIEQINRLSSVLFSNGTKFDVFDATDEEGVARTLVESEDALDVLLKKNPLLDLRIL
jgi:hypothetical protein